MNQSKESATVSVTRDEIKYAEAAVAREIHALGYGGGPLSPSQFQTLIATWAPQLRAFVENVKGAPPVERVRAFIKQNMIYEYCLAYGLPFETFAHIYPASLHEKLAALYANSLKAKRERRT